MWWLDSWLLKERCWEGGVTGNSELLLLLLVAVVVVVVAVVVGKGGTLRFVLCAWRGGVERENWELSMESEGRDLLLVLVEEGGRVLGFLLFLLESLWP